MCLSSRLPWAPVYIFQKTDDAAQAGATQKTPRFLPRCLNLATAPQPQLPDAASPAPVSHIVYPCRAMDGTVSHLSCLRKAVDGTVSGGGRELGRSESVRIRCGPRACCCTACRGNANVCDRTATGTLPRVLLPETAVEDNRMKDFGQFRCCHCSMSQAGNDFANTGWSQLYVDFGVPVR